MKQLHPSIKSVRVVGTQSLVDELSATGIEVSGGPSHAPFDEAPIDIDKFNTMSIDETIKAVIVASDPSFTYNKMCIASLYIQANQAKFICTNEETSQLVAKKDNEDGFLNYPGAGSLMESILISLNNEHGS